MMEKIVRCHSKYLLSIYDNANDKPSFGITLNLEKQKQIRYICNKFFHLFEFTSYTIIKREGINQRFFVNSF